MAWRDVPLAPWFGVTCGTIPAEGPRAGSALAKAYQRLF